LQGKPVGDEMIRNRRRSPDADRDRSVHVVRRRNASKGSSGAAGEFRRVAHSEFVGTQSQCLRRNRQAEAIAVEAAGELDEARLGGAGTAARRQGARGSETLIVDDDRNGQVARPAGGLDLRA
jgi:hypothetical protein